MYLNLLVSVCRGNLFVCLSFFNGSSKESLFLSVSLVDPCLCPCACMCMSVCMCMRVCQRQRMGLTVRLSVCHH